MARILLRVPRGEIGPRAMVPADVSRGRLDAYGVSIRTSTTRPSMVRTPPIILDDRNLTARSRG